jgi:hypothetical protein
MSPYQLAAAQARSSAYYAGRMLGVVDECDRVDQSLVERGITSPDDPVYRAGREEIAKTRRYALDSLARARRTLVAAERSLFVRTRPHRAARTRRRNVRTGATKARSPGSRSSGEASEPELVAVPPERFWRDVRRWKRVA